MIEYATRDWFSTTMRVHGTVLPRVMGRTVAVAVLTAGLLLIRKHTDLAVSIPGTAHAMVGVALGLLLVFRTNASYARFWEGRILLGGMVNNCRDLARQSVTYLPELPKEEREELGADIVAFAAVMCAYLRGERCVSAAAEHVSEDKAVTLDELAAPPLRVAAWIGQKFEREASADRLSELRLQSLDAGVSDLVDLWGGCERILKTPVPFAYAHHIKSFLTIFCFTAPLTMVASMGWYAPLAAAVVAFGLYGIDEIGVEIEDPFGRDANDLPLDAIVETIQSNVQETMAFR